MWSVCIDMFAWIYTYSWKTCKSWVSRVYFFWKSKHGQETAHAVSSFLVWPFFLGHSRAFQCREQFWDLMRYMHPYCWWKKSCISWYGKYIIICRVSYNLGSAGFLPSTVCTSLFSLLGSTSPHLLAATKINHKLWVPMSVPYSFFKPRR